MRITTQRIRGQRFTEVRIKCANKELANVIRTIEKSMIRLGFKISNGRILTSR